MKCKMVMVKREALTLGLKDGINLLGFRTI